MSFRRSALGKLVFSMPLFLISLTSGLWALEKAEVFHTYYENGVIKGEFPRKGGHLEGAAKWYYPSGALGAVMSYKSSRLEGESRTFYENGRLKKVVRMEANRPVGVSKIYSETGSLQAEELYRDGKKVGLWIYEGADGISRCEESGYLNLSSKFQEGV